MNDDLHIEKAALLADKPAAENLATGRAKVFVAQALKGRRETQSQHKAFVLKPVYAWSGVALALAACVAVFFVLFRGAPDGANPGYGLPGQLQMNESVHAATEVADTNLTESSDTLKVEQILLPE